MSQDIHCSLGPVGTMPGSFHDLPVGTMCEQHADRLAVRRIQGETDSFGCEYVCMCQECVDALRKHREDQKTVEAYCDWHKGRGLDVRPRRDYEEGTAGPMYQVCESCRLESDVRAATEYYAHQNDVDYNNFDEEE